MTLPNFIIIGAQKAGTTSLYHYLDQHPEVYMSPIKEPNFFAAEGIKTDPRDPNVTTIEEYRRLFAKVSGEKAIGEASPWYLYSEKAPQRMKYYVPDAKLVAVLRNPTERAYSQFLHFLRDGREPSTDFALALREEEARVRKNVAAGRSSGRADLGAYVSRGFYHAQLRRYYDHFGPEKIRVYLSEELSADPVGMTQDVFGFLGVDDTFAPTVSTKYNVAGIPKNKALHAFLVGQHPARRALRFLKTYLPAGLRLRVAEQHARLRSRNFVEPPQLAPEVRRHLVGVYREDILRLQDLLQRDLSAWLRA